MVHININEAKTHLSMYARRVKAGETIVLCDRNVPFAEMRPLSRPARHGKRQLGQLKGLCPIGEAFFDADSAIAESFHVPLIPDGTHK